MVFAHEYPQFQEAKYEDLTKARANIAKTPVKRHVENCIVLK